jgi:hypothetical protein
MTGLRSQRSMKRCSTPTPVCSELRLFSREAIAQACAVCSPLRRLIRPFFPRLEVIRRPRAVRGAKRARKVHDELGHNLAISDCNSLLGSNLHPGRGLHNPRAVIHRRPHERQRLTEKSRTVVRRLGFSQQGRFVIMNYSFFLHERGRPCL